MAENILNPIVVMGMDQPDVPAMKPLTIVLFIIYISGVLISLGITSFRIFSIMRLLRKYKPVKLGKHFFVFIHDQAFRPFSFFNIIFSKSPVDLNENSCVIDHKKIHIKHYHSTDVLFTECYKAVFWFNPVVRLFESALKNVHEFTADEGIVRKGYQISTYQNLLISMALGHKIQNLSSGFNQSQLKRRIIMMSKTKKSRTMFIKMLFFVPVFVAAMVFFSCNNHAGNVTSDKPVEQGDTVLKMPEFKGGQEAMNKFIISNIVYPEKAKKAVIIGRVMVSFVVTSEGKLRDIKVKESVSEELDKEALRVVALMPEWIPGEKNGKKVDVQLELPIKFQLK